ncbi:PadR family transcriptional regulator [Acrocarpospora phusangensis]|uniref:PadR family transcriptional regulator n=1 Tax=Acrocarpospora phusangensis TaxID=1070424 RepID=A0A919QI19_9ACTN|nr:PadR family transcriptional regulator [Acrocarpospora phusangensis]GIH26592.1 PadR family transcriptional regulator [Acrocarpospora phusangensis]
MPELYALHQQELRRGTIVLACLLILKKPNYGYALLGQLDRSGFAVDADTLYPLLRRLEKQELLTSDWNTEESRPRKFYRTSDQGAALADTLSRDWEELNAAFHALKEES